ncbi:sigma factor [Methylobacillus glycogenes]|uniref:sigma factor n=1 Tax=Methylobacillus glycogenes TaxID=406 RepID=UPI000B2CF077
MSSTPPSITQRMTALYSDHHGWLFAWLRKKLGCPHEAADLAQDTFMRILNSRDALLQMQEPRAYLTTTAKHLLLNQARRRAIEEAYLAGVMALGEQYAPSAEQVRAAVEALEQISLVLQGLAHKPGRPSSCATSMAWPMPRLPRNCRYQPRWCRSIWCRRCCIAMRRWQNPPRWQVSWRCTNCKQPPTPCKPALRPRRLTG